MFELKKEPWFVHNWNFFFENIFIPYTVEFSETDENGSWFRVKFLGLNQEFLEEDVKEVFEVDFYDIAKDYFSNLEKEEKKKLISLRLYESDILKIKQIAKKEGLPYQTFIASQIHKIADSYEL